MLHSLTALLPRRFAATALALALLAGAVVGGLAATSDAAPDHIILITYYSDASLTVPVGGRAIDCNGSTDRWGRVTQFIELETSPCS